MTKKLIALAVIAAGILAADSKEIAVGNTFEAPDDVADKLIADGSAKEEAAAVVSKTKTVKARVLLDGSLGKANDVIDVAADQVKTLQAEGQIDATKEAVAYALSLKEAS
jgi:hypothetical protein